MRVTLFITMFLFHLCMAVGRAGGGRAASAAAVCVLTKQGRRGAVAGRGMARPLHDDDDDDDDDDELHRVPHAKITN